ncbi:MAG: hypothetical protein KDE32_05770, partial [Novosphingobium sp.]|nr:hypothetical protein [Novosphingobium sp.]
YPAGPDPTIAICLTRFFSRYAGRFHAAKLRSEQLFESKIPDRGERCARRNRGSDAIICSGPYHT